MASLNKVMLIGNLGRAPESRELQSGMATNFSIATTRRYRSGSGEVVSETEWHNISMFGKLAEIAAQHLKKGSAVYIEGRIRSRKYQSKDGTEKTAYEIIADQMQMLSSRNDEGEAEKPAAQRRAPEPACDSDVPF